MHINWLSGLPTLEHATYNCPWEKQSVFRSIPHYSNDCTWALLMVIANRTFPASPSSFIYPPCAPGIPVVVVSLCPGRHLYSQYPGRHTGNVNDDRDTGNVRLAITINNAQGQSLESWGIDLNTDCFSHGQFYVACSRVGKPDNQFICTDTAKNVVYP